MNSARDLITRLDIDSCAKEPIHIPGSIQGHGVLFALREPELTIVQASRTTESHLGLCADAVLGTSVEGLVPESERPRFREWLLSPDVRERSPARFSFGPAIFDASAHRHDGVLILEIENPRSQVEASAELFAPIKELIGRLESAKSLHEFCTATADGVREFTGFDRVTVYRFDDEWNGEVFAESRRDDLPPLLGLHFPASDIPEQARRLYHLNRQRLIADADGATSPIVPPLNPLTARPLDLSLSHLRSASPVHRQYMRNMGTPTSMSYSLIRDGKLWGLISCLHYTEPRYVPVEIRGACDLIAKFASMQLAVKEAGEGFEYRLELQSTRDRLLMRMSTVSELAAGLLCDDLTALTGASGAAIVFDGSCAVIGATPSEAQIKSLVEWLRVHSDGDVFHTDNLPSIYPPAADFKDTGCGIVSISTTKAQGHSIVWFRPEATRTVAWGGDPLKQADRSADGRILNPRTSFELWKETVRLRSIPWQRAELDSARALRDAVIAVVVRRAEELSRLNAELERSNSDLDAFAFVTSHDLKEPLRGINNYANFIMEDYGSKLDEAGVAKLQTLVRLSQRLEDIVESLLRFSRLGRTDLDLMPVDLDAVVRGVLDLLKVSLEESNVEVRIPRKLPTVQCDPIQAELLFNNLITNAVKYNDKLERWIEIGYSEPVSGNDDRPVLYVRDNGVGIPEKHRDIIFRMFKRLHGRDKFGGGSGAGLAFAKKIVDRHGGSIWVDSTPKSGSTFYFILGGIS